MSYFNVIWQGDACERALMCLGSIGTVSRTWDEGGMPMAEIDTGIGTRAVCTVYHPDVTVGTDVLAHMGFVIEILDPDRAAEARAFREELGAAG